ncbi:unnamed protein product [Closterium sp. NIES-65]|nr:unnamed protein product [Closterium sp. NIES-65]
MPSLLARPFLVHSSLPGFRPVAMAALPIGLKRVAVIGGGPAGLASAKYLLEAGLQPTLFEKAASIGGLWRQGIPSDSGEAVEEESCSKPAARASDGAPACWAGMMTNLSRVTCSFSDHPWADDAPLFPSQAQVLAYLKSYAHRFLIPPGSNSLAASGSLRLNARVSRVALLDDGKWSVQVDQDGRQQNPEVFDSLVVASGFFEKTHIPNVPGADAAAAAGVLMHSANYRSSDAFAGKKVVVVGTSFSGVDIAADVASKASEVIHVITKPFWLLPRFLPADPSDPASPFLPLDLCFYRRASRPSPSLVVLRSEEARRAANKYMRALCGDQGKLLCPELGVSSSDSEHPFIAISDQYGPMVQQGLIRVLPRRVQGVLLQPHSPQDSSTPLQASVILQGTDERIDGVDALICCTGYSPALPFLPTHLKEQIGFDSSDLFSPLLLHRCTFHPSLPSAAMVGMYRGPYFAVMELQARWAAAVLSGALPPVPTSTLQEGVEEARKVREQQPRPQFPVWDYVGMCNSLSEALGCALPTDPEWMRAHDVVVPAHYCTPTTAPSVAAAEVALAQLTRACSELEGGSAVAGAVFRGLAGKWRLEREIRSVHEGLPSGTMQGTATFTMRPGEGEYLYREEGEFVMAGSAGRKGNKVWREYVWVCEGPEDGIAVHFADKSQRTYLFHHLRFFPDPSESGSSPDKNEGLQSADFVEKALPRAWRAVGEHLCVKDLYKVAYRFAFQGVHVERPCDGRKGGGGREVEEVVRFILGGGERGAAGGGGCCRPSLTEQLMAHMQAVAGGQASDALPALLGAAPVPRAVALPGLAAGAAEEGAVEEGAVEEGAAEEGAVREGAAEEGAAEEGAVEEGAAEGAAEEGAVEEGAVERPAAEGVATGGAATERAATEGVAEEGAAALAAAAEGVAAQDATSA